VSATWWSANPDKAAFERLTLIYTPIWMAIVALVMLTGVHARWGDLGFMVFGVGLAAPLLLAPLAAETPAQRASWLRLNLWLAIFVFVGNYVCTHYFFAVAGMRYGFPVSWTFEAELVGASGVDGKVPLFLYPMTHAYFATYHVGATVVHRYLSARFELGRAAQIALIAALAYGVAFAETFCMAVPALSEVFEYAERGRMLRWGSVFYGSFFIVSLPVFARVDEPETWPLGRTVASALAVSMTVVLVLDLWAKLIGSLGA